MPADLKMKKSPLQFIFRKLLMGFSLLCLGSTIYCESPPDDSKQVPGSVIKHPLLDWPLPTGYVVDSVFENQYLIKGQTAFRLKITEVEDSSAAAYFLNLNPDVGRYFPEVVWNRHFNIAGRPCKVIFVKGWYGDGSSTGQQNLSSCTLSMPYICFEAMAISTVLDTAAILSGLQKIQFKK